MTSNPLCTRTPRVAHRAGRLAVLSLLALIVVVPQLGCSLFEAVGEATGNQDLAAAARSGRALLNGFSDENEYFYGRGVSGNVFMAYETPDYTKPTPPVVAQTVYLNLVGGILAVNSDRPNLADGWHFVILESDVPAAFSAPGGFVFVSRGLIAMTETEDELAAVLAHEIAHICLEHGLTSIKNETWKEFATSSLALTGQATGDQELAKLASGFSKALDKGWADLLNGWSVEQETVADQRGLHYLARTGYDPGALGRVLKKLLAYQAVSGAFSKTHPGTQSRIDAATSYVAQHKMSGVVSAARTARFTATLKP